MRRHVVRRSAAVILSIASMCGLSACQSASRSTCAVTGVDGKPLRTYEEVVASLPRHDLSGRIVTASGAPVADATVYLYHDCGPGGRGSALAGKTTTGADGVYRFAKSVVWASGVGRVSRGDMERYALIATHPQQGEYFRIVLGHDPLENVDVVLPGKEKYRDVNGNEPFVTVTDLAGKPIAGARVYINRAELPELDAGKLSWERGFLMLHSDIGWYAGVTDEKGQFPRLAMLGAGYTVEKPGYVRALAFGNIELHPAAEVCGRVTWPDGTPAADVAVQCQYRGAQTWHEEYGTTDAQGVYRFDNIPGSGFVYRGTDPNTEKGTVGKAAVRVVDPRPYSPFIGREISFPIHPGDKLTNDIVFERGCVLSGVVIDTVTGKPVPGMLLGGYANIRGGQSFNDLGLKTDETGFFAAAVPPGSEVFLDYEPSREGSYCLDTKAMQQQPGLGRPFPQGLASISGDRTGLVFKVMLMPIATLTGQVVNAAGQGVPGVTVYISGQVRPVLTDTNGGFVIKAAPQDREFDVLASLADEGLTGWARLKGGTASVTIPLAPLRDYMGEVTTVDDLPCQNLKFTMDLQLNGTSIYTLRREVRTDDKGRFSVSGLCAQASYLVWWSPGNENNRDYENGRIDIDLSAMKDGDPIRFKANMLVNAVVGRVLNEKGEPVAGAIVNGVVADEKGNYALTRLPGGTITLRATAKDYKAQTRTVPTDSVDCDFVLMPRAGEETTYGISVKDAAGSPVPNAPLTLWLIWRDGMGVTTNASTVMTDAAGRACLKVGKVQEGRRLPMAIIGCDVAGFSRTFVQVGSEQDEDLDLVLTPEGPARRVRVLNEVGKPITDAVVTVQFLSTDGQRRRVYVPQTEPAAFPGDSDGYYRLDRFSAANDINLRVAADGYVETGIRLDAVTNAQTDKTLQMVRAGSVEGRLVMKGWSGPTSNVSIRVSGDGSEGCYGSTTPAADGSFRMDGVGPGECHVYASNTNADFRQLVYRDGYPRVTVKAGEVASVVLEMEPGITVHGTLFKTGTKEVLAGNRAVFARATDGKAGGSASVESNGVWTMYLPEGSFELSSGPVGVATSRERSPLKTITVSRDKQPDAVVLEVSE